MEQLLKDVEQYYTHKIAIHGATPLGVDWSCVPTQEMRFVQLLKLFDSGLPITLNDVGCGYGALLAFLKKRYRTQEISYLGIDLSAAMITQAQQLWRKRPHTDFVVAATCPRIADYSIASGIFNVKLNQPVELWERFIAATLADMHGSSAQGFAVNFLAPLPPDTPSVPELYRVSADVWTAHCEKVFGLKVKVIAGYGMREYTLLARKR